MKEESLLYGHNDRRYRQVVNWGKLDAGKYPVKDCHEMVQDKMKQIYMLTNEIRNNILIYNTSGALMGCWGHQFPGGHGLTINNENGEEFLFITDTQLNQVYKTSLSGTVMMTVNYPAESGLYNAKAEFIPTETAVAPNGDFYIADGYGKQYILHYDAAGKLLGWFGGRGESEEQLDNAHGICIDTRQEIPTLLVTDRTRCCFKRYSLSGTFLGVIPLPGACVCRPVIKGDYLYAAVLRSPNMQSVNSGFVTILDKQNKVISNIGGNEPVYDGNILQPMQQTIPLFIHPHDVCVDEEESIYVTQWASGQVYPYKFIRV